MIVLVSKDATKTVAFRQDLRQHSAFALEGMEENDIIAQERTKRRRGGGRAGNAKRRGTRAIDQMPWRSPINSDKPTEPLSEEGVNAIHEGAMKILEDIGIAILNDEAREIFK